jgi:hypothetical protein
LIASATDYGNNEATFTIFEAQVEQSSVEERKQARSINLMSALLRRIAASPGHSAVSRSSSNFRGLRGFCEQQTFRETT